MKTTTIKNTMISSAIALAMGLSAAQLHASEGQAAGQVNPPTTGQQLSDDVNRAAANTENRRMNHDPVDAEDFVETASAKAHAAINTAQMALEEGSPALRVYANKIIEDHTVTNNELKAVAARADIDVADDATLMDRAKAMVLSVRSEESFDEAFIKNQITTHEESIELFERAANSDVPEISAFARGKLPALHEHLRMATALRAQISGL
jgi:putative membrane protein